MIEGPNSIRKEEDLGFDRCNPLEPTCRTHLDSQGFLGNPVSVKGLFKYTLSETNMDPENGGFQ